MNLEDHLGDILRKGRLHAGITLEAAAQAAGLGTAALAALEETGALVERPDFAALARLLSLDAAKLERIAQGWLPSPPPLDQWRELRLISTTEEGYAVNNYLIWDEVTREAALFDTGFDAAPSIRCLEENQLVLRYIFITHSHGDHVAGLPHLRERFPKARLRSGAASAPPEQRNRANDCLQLGSLRVMNRATPGHAADGVSYVIGNWPDDAPHVIVVGDALFAGSMGKAGGAAASARQHIREQILSLPPTTLICPGHGPLTTVAEELANNPFFP
jgi:glyoxylase-like metal-dependent hydrolase (beta-lactamase superfamily II)